MPGSGYIRCYAHAGNGQVLERVGHEAALTDLAMRSRTNGDQSIRPGDPKPSVRVRSQDIRRVYRHAGRCREIY